MTTIVYNPEEKEVGIDSRCSAGSVIVADAVVKAHKNELGLWFCAGALCDFVQFITLKKDDIVNHKLDVSAFLIRDEKCFSVFINDDLRLCEELIEYNEGLGSGGYAAQAALDFGTSTREAIEYAISKDVYSGGQVHIYNMKGDEIYE